MAKVLVADDERSICEAFSDILRAEGHTPLVASSGDEALRMIAADAPDIVFLDVQMPGMDGLQVLEKIHVSHPRLPVIVMTAYGTLQTAIDAQRLHAFDYLGKPVELKQIRRLLERALYEPSAEKIVMADLPDGQNEMVGRSAVMQEVFKSMSMLATNDLTVLITGESGVGKELVARGIHFNGDRAGRPFIVVNCAAIPDTLIESEFFGHERGAFTDAKERRQGRFEAAADGTLFLDEISELPYAVQGKLLRVLQERTFERLGSVTPLKFRARLVVASNRDLQLEMDEGRFRQDLYHRLDLVTLKIPPLRERKDDIGGLAVLFLCRANAKMGRKIEGIEPATIKELESHDWAGNVRELEHVIQRAVLNARGSLLTLHDLVMPRNRNTPAGVLGDSPASRLGAVARSALREALDDDNASPFQTLVGRIEQELIDEALSITGDNQVAAAKLLGLNRSTLRKKMRK
jgi:DNA-binding NtrC family response regulator